MSARSTQSILLQESRHNFDREADLVELLVDRLPKTFRAGGNSILVAKEVAVGRSIADIVMLRRYIKARTIKKNLSVAQAVILSYVRKRGYIDVDQLKEIARTSDRDAELFNRLFANDLLGYAANSEEVVVPLWDPNYRIVAVEAKLSRWRDALAQATSYRTYADESYVALPVRQAMTAAKSRDLFDAAGVGLLSTDSTGRINVLLRAAVASNHGWQREFVVSRLSTQLYRIQS